MSWISSGQETETNKQQQQKKMKQRTDEVFKKLMVWKGE